MFHHVNTILLSAAGAVFALAFLARRALWTRANVTPTDVVYAPGHASIVNAPYVSAGDWYALHRTVVVDDDTGVITIVDGAGSIVEYEHEGTTERLTPGADLARVPERVLALTSRELREQERHAERAAIREVSDIFERFDRMTTRGMAHVDTICAATIQRWIDEADPRDELESWHEYFSAELPTIEREYAQALLVS